MKSVCIIIISWYFQTELRIPLGYEKKTGQAIALALKQFGLRRVFSSVYLLAKRYQI